MKKLTGGLRRDERTLNQPNNTWVDAKNVVVYKNFKSVSNEDGVEDVTPVSELVNGIQYENFPVNKIVIGCIVTNTEKVFFFAGNSPYDSEIGVVTENNLYNCILKDISSTSGFSSILNFNINHPIQGDFQYKYNNELIISFTDNFNPPRILNTNCILFKTLPNCEIDPIDALKAKNLLQLFPNHTTPIIQADNDLEVRQGQGLLKTGVYYPIVSYELPDGSYTFWTKIYNAIPIYEDNTSLGFYQVGGSVADITTSKYITIKFSNVDISFKYLRVGFLYKKNGQLTAYYSSKYNINSSTVNIEITGTESTIEIINLNEVLIPNTVYDKVKTLTNYQSKLYLGNVKQAADINFQNEANLIEIKWVKEKNISLNSRVQSTRNAIGDITNYGSYKDPSLVFFNKNFKSGECYAFYIVLKFKNGLYSKAYHIPGRQLTATDRTVLSGTGNANIDNIGINVLKYQIQDTSGASGVMGVWENINEEYPLDATNTNIHPDYANVPGITLANRKIRHHVFPDLRNLKIHGHNFQNIDSSYSCSRTTSAINFGNPDFENLIGYYDFPTVGGVCPDFSVAGVDGKTLYSNFSTSGIFNMVVDFKNMINGTVSQRPGDCIGIDDTTSSDGPNKVFLYWKLFINGNQIVSYVQEQTQLQNTGTFPITNPIFNFSVSPNDRIEVEYLVYVTRNNNSAGDAFNVGDFTGCFVSDIAVTFSKREVSTEILGIEVSNINIPASIKDQIDSYEIVYAKRTQNNIRVVAQDMIKDGRFHNFDLLSTKITAQAKYFKPQLNYGSTQLQDTVNSLLAVESIVPTETVEVINNFQYVGQDVSLPVSNVNRAENIYIVGGVTGSLPNTTEVYLQSTYSPTNTLMDICTYKQDMYRPFDTQELVSTGYTVKVTNSGIQNSTEIWGGDTFINIFGFRLYLSNINNYLLTCETVSNIDLRYAELNLSKQYFPKYNEASPSYYGYNKDYNCISDLTKLVIHNTSGNCNTDNITDFPQRVPFSIVDANENKFLNWRIFKVNDYYEMPKNKGVIWNILGVDRTLYIHHEYALFLASIKDKLGNSGNETFLGSSDVFDRPPVEVVPINEGYCGTQSQYGIIYCKLGYCFIDRQMGKVFIHSTDSPIPPKEISNQGLYNFFRDNTQNTLSLIDNPFIGNGYTMAYDEQLNRLVITKKDAEFDFTISYCPDLNQGQGGWVSFHDYKPHYLLFNRSGFYGVDNSQNKLFKHNNKLVKAIYYDGLIKDSYIDVPFNPSPEITKQLQSVNWQSNVVKLDTTILENETITHLMVYNDNQCSGLIDIKAEKDLWFGKDARNLEETYNFNNFRDLIKDKFLPFLNKKRELIVANINLSKSWFKKNRFISKFVIVRFSSDNKNQHDLHIIDVNASFTKSDR